MLHMYPGLCERVLQQLQNGWLIVRAQGQSGVPKPLDILHQGVDGIVLRIYSFLGHHVTKYGFAQRIFCNQYREVDFGTLEYGPLGYWDACLVQVQVIKREYTDPSSVPPLAVLIASPASSHTLAAPVAIRNVPFGTVVFNVRGSTFIWAWKDAIFGILDLHVFIQINVVVQGVTRDNRRMSFFSWPHVICLDCIVISE